MKLTLMWNHWIFSGYLQQITFLISLYNLKTLKNCITLPISSSTTNRTVTNALPFNCTLTVLLLQTYYRGEPELIQRVLETLHKKYDQNDPETSSTSEDVIPGDSTSTERDNIKIDTSSQQEDANAGM